MTWRRAAILIVLLVAGVYGRCVGFGFTLWDDGSTVAGNPRLVAGWGGLRAIWTEDQGALYVPVTYTAWWGTAHVAGVRAWAFHGLSVGVHALASVGCLLLMRRLGFRVWAGVLGAAVFAAHPLQSESVAWVSGGKDVISGALGVWALWAHVERRRSWYWGLLLAALLAKPGAVVVPGMVVMLDLLGRRGWWEIGWTAAVGCALAGCVAAVAHWVQPGAAMGTAVAWGNRPAVALDALGWYARALAGVTELCVDLGRRPEEARAWVGLGTLGAAALLVGTLRDRRAWVGAGIAVIGVGPYLGLVSFEFQAYSTVAAHYAYLGMVGVGIVLAAFVERRFPLGWRTELASRARAAGVGRRALVGAWLGFLAWRCWGECGAFVDSRALFERALVVNPASWAAAGDLGAVALGEGDAALAERWARASLRSRVRQVGANVTLGAALERLGDDVGAEAAFRAAVGVDGGQAEAWSALGTLLARTGRVGEGEVDLRRAVAMDPYLAEARAALGVLLAGQGKLAEAEGELARAARLRPGDAGIANNLLTVRKMISSGRKDGGSEGGRGRNP